MKKPSLQAAIVIVVAAATVCSLGATEVVLAKSNPHDDLELAFNGHCRECHAFDKGDNRLGPSLYGVVGRKAGIVPGFAYSDSLKSSGITWDIEAGTFSPAQLRRRHSGGSRMSATSRCEILSPFRRDGLRAA
jgi:cytochrome c2